MKITALISAAGIALALACPCAAEAQGAEAADSAASVQASEACPVPACMPGLTSDTVPELYRNIYAQPYSQNKDIYPKPGRMLANAGVLTGAFVSTLMVLEALPENATSWNRAELQDVPLGERWYNHVIKEGPEWDNDLFIYNYVLHPYAGAVYFMAARSCGYSFWHSMIFSAVISNVCWEFGIEAFMERPSYQDLFITPVIGSCIGEAFYHIKRHIVAHNYTLAGSPVLGNIVVFLIDPVNEVVNLFRGSDTRRMHLGAKPKGRRIESSLTPMAIGGAPGFSLTVTF
ncbi:MAG: DUF3943 domain-containing protein [Duncaniella sp.]|nr:DUF3943 domain-containing protein [Duncaniella sp.]MDE6178214.1 DUF3943 domain-containing protein [Duncaniella sp.]MDE6389852.1 DUF3943 domain-containing protein [Duncaniella sp.]